MSSTQERPTTEEHVGEPDNVLETDDTEFNENVESPAQEHDHTSSATIMNELLVAGPPAEVNTTEEVPGDDGIPTATSTHGQINNPSTPPPRYSTVFGSAEEEQLLGSFSENDFFCDGFYTRSPEDHNTAPNQPPAEPSLLDVPDEIDGIPVIGTLEPTSTAADRDFHSAYSNTSYQLITSGRRSSVSRPVGVEDLTDDVTTELMGRTPPSANVLSEEPIFRASRRDTSDPPPDYDVAEDDPVPPFVGTPERDRSAVAIEEMELDDNDTEPLLAPRQSYSDPQAIRTSLLTEMRRVISPTTSRAQRRRSINDFGSRVIREPLVQAAQKAKREMLRTDVSENIASRQRLDRGDRGGDSGVKPDPAPQLHGQHPTSYNQNGGVFVSTSFFGPALALADRPDVPQEYPKWMIAVGNSPGRAANRVRKASENMFSRIREKASSTTQDPSPSTVGPESDLVPESGSISSSQNSPATPIARTTLGLDTATPPRPAVSRLLEQPGATSSTESIQGSPRTPRSYQSISMPRLFTDCPQMLGDGRSVSGTTQRSPLAVDAEETSQPLLLDITPIRRVSTVVESPGGTRHESLPNIDATFQADAPSLPVSSSNTALESQNLTPDENATKVSDSKGKSRATGNENQPPAEPRPRRFSFHPYQLEEDRIEQDRRIIQEGVRRSRQMYEYPFWQGESSASASAALAASATPSMPAAPTSELTSTLRRDTARDSTQGNQPSVENKTAEEKLATLNEDDDSFVDHEVEQGRPSENPPAYYDAPTTTWWMVQWPEAPDEMSDDESTRAEMSVENTEEPSSSYSSTDVTADNATQENSRGLWPSLKVFRNRSQNSSGPRWFDIGNFLDVASDELFTSPGVYAAESHYRDISPLELQSDEPPNPSSENANKVSTFAPLVMSARVPDEPDPISLGVQEVPWGCEIDATVSSIAKKDHAENLEPSVQSESSGMPSIPRPGVHPNIVQPEPSNDIEQETQDPIGEAYSAYCQLSPVEASGIALSEKLLRALKTRTPSENAEFIAKCRRSGLFAIANEIERWTIDPDSVEYEHLSQPRRFPPGVQGSSSSDQYYTDRENDYSLYGDSSDDDSNSIDDAFGAPLERTPSQWISTKPKSGKQKVVTTVEQEYLQFKYPPLETEEDDDDDEYYDEDDEDPAEDDEVDEDEKEILIHLENLDLEIELAEEMKAELAQQTDALHEDHFPPDMLDGPVIVRKSFHLLQQAQEAIRADLRASGTDVDQLTSYSDMRSATPSSQASVSTSKQPTTPQKQAVARSDAVATPTSVRPSNVNQRGSSDIDSVSTSSSASSRRRKMMSFSGSGWDPDYRTRSVSLGLSKENVMRGTPSPTEIVLSPCQWGSVRGKSKMIELSPPDSPSQHGDIREYSSPSYLNAVENTRPRTGEVSPSVVKRKSSNAIAALKNAQSGTSTSKPTNNNKASELEPERRTPLYSRPSVGARRKPATVAAQQPIPSLEHCRDLTAESGFVREPRAPFQLKHPKYATKASKEKDATVPGPSKARIAVNIPATEDISPEEQIPREESPEHEHYVMDLATENNTMRNCSGSYTTVTLPVRRGLGFYFSPPGSPQEPQRRKFRIRDSGSTTDSMIGKEPVAPISAKLDTTSVRTTGRKISILLPPSRPGENDSTEQKEERKDSSVSVTAGVDGADESRTKRKGSLNSPTSSQAHRTKTQDEIDDVFFRTPLLGSSNDRDNKLSIHIKPIFESSEEFDGSSSSARHTAFPSGTWNPASSDEDDDNSDEEDDSDESSEEEDDDNYFLTSPRQAAQGRDRRYRSPSPSANRREGDSSESDSGSNSNSETGSDTGDDHAEEETSDTSPPLDEHSLPRTTEFATITPPRPMPASRPSRHKRSFPVELKSEQPGLDEFYEILRQEAMVSSTPEVSLMDEHEQDAMPQVPQSPRLPPLSLDDEGKEFVFPKSRKHRANARHKPAPVVRMPGQARLAQKKEEQRVADLRRKKREKREELDRIEQEAGQMMVDEYEESMTDNIHIEDYAMNLKAASQKGAVRGKTNMMKFPAPTSDPKAVERLLEQFVLGESRSEPLKHTTPQRRERLERTAQKLGGWVEEGPYGGSFVATPEGQKIGGFLVEQERQRREVEEAERQMQFEQQLAHDPELQKQLHQLQTSINTTSTFSHQTAGSHPHPNAPISNPTPQALALQSGNNDRASPPTRDTITTNSPTERARRFL